MPSKPHILILFAHLALQQSRINSAMAGAIRGMEGVTFHDLLEAYPDFYIDVETERRLLAHSDLIVFHHPIYWYSAPAEAYRPDGVHGYPLEEFLRPFEQMARFCGMNYLPPLVVQGGVGLSDEQIRAHAGRYRDFLADYRPAGSSGS